MLLEIISFGSDSTLVLDAYTCHLASKFDISYIDYCMWWWHLTVTIDRSICYSYILHVQLIFTLVFDCNIYAIDSSIW